MRSVGFVGTKGGCAKSTSATCIAVAAQQSGQRVILVDADPQCTTFNWSQRRQRSPNVVKSTVIDLPQVLRWADMQQYDWAFVDGLAHSKRALVAVANATQLSILCSGPTLLDVEVAMADRACISARPYALMLTKTPPVFNRRLQAWHRAASQLGSVVGSMLADRVAYADAIGIGLGVTEFAPASPAAEEVREALRWINQRLQEMENAAA